MGDLALLLPEIILAITLVGIVAGEVGFHGERVRLLSITALIGLAAALIQTLLSYQAGDVSAFGGALRVDALARFFKIFFIALAGLSIVSSMSSRELGDDRRAEYCGLILAATLGMSLAASASDLLLLFLAIQFTNIVGYFLAAFDKRSILSTEAAVKYLAFGTVAGALFLYGLAVLFLSSQSLNLEGVHAALLATPMGADTGLTVFILLLLALSFQTAAFPMYLWAPDVIQGAPTPVSGFLSIGARAMGFAVALRVLLAVFSAPAELAGRWQVLGAADWPRITALVAGMTMGIGALLAIRQVSAKRLVANLVVVQTGFLLMGLVVLDRAGQAALLYNLVVELFALTGIFYVLSYYVDVLKSDRLADLRGMLISAVPESVALVWFLISLVGIPPSPGFIGKFALIEIAVRHDWHFLGLVGIAAMALSALAVARLAFSLMGEPRSGFASGPNARSRRAFLAVLIVPIILIAVFAEAVLSWAGRSLQSVF